MTESNGEADPFYDDHLVETPESLRDSNPENPELDPRADEDGEAFLASEKWGVTAEEERLGEPLDLRLSEEEPEFGSQGRSSVEQAPQVGRLVEEDEGAHPDLEKDLVARDLGPDGGDYSAEEAAIHIIDEP